MKYYGIKIIYIYCCFIVLFANWKINSAPTSLSQAQNGAVITLSWNDVGASSYIVKVRDPLDPWNDPSSFSDTVKTNSFVLPFVIQGFTFEWRGKAVCVVGEFTSNSSMRILG